MESAILHPCRTSCMLHAFYYLDIISPALLRYCVVAIAVMVFAVAVWFVWRIALPWLFHYRLVRTKTTLSDGTLVTVVSHSIMESSNAASHASVAVVRKAESSVV